MLRGFVASRHRMLQPSFRRIWGVGPNRAEEGDAPKYGREGEGKQTPVTRPTARQSQGHGQRIAGSEFVLSPAKITSLTEPNDLSGPSPRLLEANLARDNVRFRQFG